MEIITTTAIYLGTFGELAKTNNTMIIPQNMTDISAMIATATKVFEVANSTGNK